MAEKVGCSLVRSLTAVCSQTPSGSIVPLSRGAMRNEWFPAGTADYVTMPELKKLRLAGAPMERDFTYGLNEGRTALDAISSEDSTGNLKSMSNEEVVDASAFQKRTPVDRLSPERSTELLEMFVRPRLEFYRQPIMEEKVVEPEPPVPEPRKKASYGSGAGAELLAARMGGFVQPKVAKDGPQGIYGSVSPLDVLQAVRAAMAEDDDAKRVVLSEQDVHFVDLPDIEGETAKVVKHVGDFAVEIKVKGAERIVRRVVAVIPQEL